MSAIWKKSPSRAGHSVDALRLALIVAGTLLIVLIVFTPRLSLMREPSLGTFQWTRGLTFLKQCEQPFRTDIESAMHWRVLPPLVAHTVGLSGHAAFLLPWLGALAATTYVAVLFRRRIDNWRWVAGGTLLFTSSSAILVPLHWLGVNDGWVWLGLLAVSFGRAKWTLPASCLLCPWVDERFIIGFPLALLCALLSRSSRWSIRDSLAGLWLVPYLATRFIVSLYAPDAAANTLGFIQSVAHNLAPMTPWIPLAWWMGLRAGWLPFAYAVSTVPTNLRALTAATLALTLSATVFLAADLSRSIAIVSPLVLLGCFAYAERHPVSAAGVLLKLALFNLLVPAAHIVHNKIDLISPLPIELVRIVRLRD